MPKALFSEARNLGVDLYLDKGKLVCRARGNALTADLKARISQNKEALIALLKQYEAYQESSELLAIHAREQGAVAPLSFAQQGLWLLEKIEGSNANYLISGALHLEGDLDLDALTKSLGEIVSRHESLRTVFNDDEKGQPYSTIQEDPNFQLDIHDWRNESESHKSAKQEQWLCANSVRLFDLTQDILLRSELARLQDNEHVLLLVMHHIASDGWSIGILINELSTLYNANKQGNTKPLSPLSVQYGDYAYWQRTALDKILVDQLAYWRHQLRDIPDLHSLPLDYTRPATQGHTGETLRSTISTQSLSALKSLCDKQGATLFMGLHAVFSILLARYSREKDIVVGTPIANREQDEVADLIGFFANTLVLRSKVSNEHNFVDLLQQCKQTTLDAYAHQQLPFEQLVEALQPNRSASHSPIFQIMIALQNNPEQHLSLDGLNVSPIPIASSTAKYDLTLNIEEVSAGLTLSWEYNTGLFEAATIARMSAHFSLLLDKLVAAPEQSCLTLDLLLDEEQGQLHAWNETGVDYPGDRCVHRLFESQAEKTPDAVALVFEDKKMRYAELNTRSNRLAAYLIEQGVEPGSLVGICMARSFDMVISIIATLKAGAAYVPVDPEYPQARLDYIVEDAGLNILLTTVDSQTKVQKNGLRCIAVDDGKILQHLDSLADENNNGNRMLSASADSNGDSLAYVIYTSGSTGNPKGVMIEHRSLANHMHWMLDTFGFTREASNVGQETVVLQKTPFGFDASVWELFSALLCGGQLVLASSTQHKDPQQLAQLIEQHQVTVFQAVPSMAKAMLDLNGLERLSSLRLFFCGGEALSSNLAASLNKALPRAEIYNLYGPTEATIDATYQRVVTESSEHTPPAIGRAIANTALYVLSETGQLAAIGLPGELCISGEGLARGYLNRPDLTAEKFITNPFSIDSLSDNLSNNKLPNKNPRARLYKTGDLVRWRPNGELEFLGRIDHQVKLRGFRVELGEIESALLGLESVSDGAVLAIDDNQRLVAYVVLSRPAADNMTNNGGGRDSHKPSTIETLREQLVALLPEYMVPSAFVLLDALPLTSNGKLDRKALPAPEYHDEKCYLAPRTEVEKILCDIWQSVLGIERIGLNDNFFHLGGHSLLVIQVIAQLQQRGYNVDVRRVFSLPKLADLALSISNASPQDSAPENLIPADCRAVTPEMLPLINLDQEAIDRIAKHIPGGMANIQDIYPLGPLQEGILFHHRLDPDNDTYVLPYLLHLKDRHQLVGFVAALEKVIARHDVLRTVFLWEGLPMAVQVVQREATFVVDTVAVDNTRPVVDQLKPLVVPEGQSIDLSRAPLLHLQVAADPSSEGCYLILKYHHLIFDHVGLEIITEEIAAILQDQEESLAPAAPYREFVAQTLAQRETQESEAYFTRLLADVEQGTMPYGLANTHRDSGAIVEKNCPLDSVLAKDIRELSRRLSLSPATIFHVAFGIVVGHCSGRDDVVFGTVLSGRLQGTLNAGSLLGLFINTLPVRIPLADISVTEAVAAAQSHLTDILSHEQTPLSLAQACSGLASGEPLFSALLNYRHSATASPSADDEIALPLALTLVSGQERTNYPFGVSVDDLGEGFALTAQVEETVDPDRVLAYLIQALVHLVDALAHSPNVGLSELEIIPEAERDLISTQWNQTPADYPQDRCIHQLFEAQVERTPDALALVYEAQSLSYRQLNQRSNQLAHSLIAQGVKPDQLVGICVERSIDMVVGLLAVLKAGGAYVPIDPSYPSARIAYMLEDSGITLLLTQASLVDALPLADLSNQKQTLLLDDENIYSDVVETPVCSAGPEHLAYAIYTSGSTGQPKASLIEHRGLCNLATAQANTFEVDATSKVLQFASFAFDAATSEWAMALCSGASLHLVTQALIQDPGALGKAVAAKAMTHATLPPALLPALNMAHWSTVSHLIVAGDSCPLPLAKQWAAGRNFYNAYGPSEATVCASICRFDAEHDHLSIGQPMANVETYVLDTQRKLCALGVPGELHIGGAGLARSYLNRPELSAEKFIAHPFSDKAGARLYKTGDLVRWLPVSKLSKDELSKGELDFLGRIDDQVKLRGYRIELGEIESALLALDDVSEAVVVAVDEPKRLLAYVVCDSSATQGDEKTGAAVETLRAQLSEYLPDYMMPSAFMLLESIPLTANGKIDRKALPNPEYINHNAYVAPRTETEQVLCDIWQQVLDLDRVGVHDNFFHLGGHSLSATKALAALDEYFGLEFPLSLFFQAPHIVDISVHIENIIAARNSQACLDEVLVEEGEF